MKYFKCLLIVVGLMTLPLSVFSQFGTTSSGKTVAGVFNELEYTIGEAIVTNYSSDNNYMSSGIIQPLMVEGMVVSLSTISFSAQTVGDDVAIDWMINQDHQQDYFLIERRFDESLDFSVIDQVEAKSQIGLVGYEIIDSNILNEGVYYYRLKIIDENGSFAYSETRSVFVDFDKDLIVNVYPNPTNSLLTVDANDVDIWGYELFAVGGVKVDDGDVDSNNINLSHLNDGSYVLRLKSSKEDIFKIVQIVSSN